MSKQLKTDEHSRLPKYRQLLVAFKKDSDTWNEQRKKVEKIYMGVPVGAYKRSTYNSLWANTSILTATCFSRIPRPVCERRFKDKDPIGLLASKLEERAVSFSLSAEENDFYYAVNDAVRDRFLGGIGIAWVRYEPYFEEVIDEATQTTKLDDTGSPIQRVSFEEAVTDYILPSDFGWNSNARTPREMRQIWKRVRFTRSKLISTFGAEAAAKIPLDDFDEEKWNLSGLSRQDTVEPRASIIELWDKETKKVYWFTEGSSEAFLKIQDDPLKLKGFFPVPRPLLASLCGQSLFPTPDYIIYEELAQQLNDVNTRLGHLTNMVRLTGIHSAEINESLDKLRSAVDGTTIPISNWSNTQGSGGLGGLMEWLPIQDVANAIQQLESRAEALENRIYGITGMSDIVRGSSNPYETKGAQEIKNQWASIRVLDRQHDVQRFIRDLLELKAEIICKHFSDESWMLMTGYGSLTPEEQSIFPQALALLRNDNMRTFRISLETDSTIEINEDKDKASRLEFVNALANLFAQGGQIMSIDPALKTTALQTILMAARGFRQSREVEQYLNQSIDKMILAQQQAEANPQPPQPSPEELELQAKQQIEQAKLEFEMAKSQQEQALEQYKIQTDAQLKQWKAEQDLALKEFKLQSTLALQEEKMALQSKAQEEKLQMQFVMNEEKLKAEFAMKQLELLNASRDGEEKGESEEKKEPSTIVLNIDAKGASKKVVRLGDKVGVIEDVTE